MTAALKASPAPVVLTRPAAMRAAIVTGPGTCAIREVPLPEPGPGQVRVRNSGCGVCASNLVPWAGPDWMQFPTQPGGLGHEGWGIVDALGPDVTDLESGQPVATLFQNSYAEYDVGDAAAVLPLPEGFEERAFPGEPLGCAMNIFRRSDIATGQTVAIVGAGFLGALLTRLASQAGAHVVAVSRRTFALDVARRMGAAECIALDDRHAVRDRVQELTGGTLCERVIEATGKQGPLTLAGELTGERGRLVIAGYHQDGPRQIDMQLWNWRGLDVINAHERDPRAYLSGMREGLAAVLDGTIDLEALVTHSYRLEDLGQALDDTRDRPDGFLKAVVRM
ncbi:MULTISPECIES: zinc-binding dehydrogenase [unclassified Chelatococcus]|uniref:MDR/zinc-dependent alcohol dehydrogenase-like family protein n=1 Tax=unclassified Chelatococcus TaxID=2638111 RepID=UPI0002FEE913|nr:MULTISPECIES: zinc-binding dehydrogenase [unclassified Chelatococcus]ALA19210.1 L-iditol 2-dehydrogenase [Chelatococcus sp. CO-6]